MECVGTHVLGELSCCDNIATYDSSEKMKELLENCAKESNLNIIRIETHKFEPQGISGLIFLKESHFSIHAFPENKYCAVDAYTCGVDNELSAFKIVKLFVNAIGCKYVHLKSYQRGVLFDKDNNLFHTQEYTKFRPFE